jgi:uncharacterized protein (TIGR00369 family)
VPHGARGDALLGLTAPVGLQGPEGRRGETQGTPGLPSLGVAQPQLVAFSLERPADSERAGAEIKIARRRDICGVDGTSGGGGGRCPADPKQGGVGDSLVDEVDDVETRREAVVVKLGACQVAPVAPWRAGVDPRHQIVSDGGPLGFVELLDVGPGLGGQDLPAHTELLPRPFQYARRASLSVMPGSPPLAASSRAAWTIRAISSSPTSARHSSSRLGWFGSTALSDFDVWLLCATETTFHRERLRRLLAGSPPPGLPARPPTIPVGQVRVCGGGVLTRTRPLQDGCADASERAICARRRVTARCSSCWSGRPTDGAGWRLGSSPSSRSVRPSLTYIGLVLNEPVRGSLPGPNFFSLPGLDQLRAFMQGLVPRTPYGRLLGYRITQASSGTVVLNLPVSAWFDIYDGFIDLAAIAEVSVFCAAITVAPPGTFVRTVNMSLRHLRACTVEDETVIARGRILHAGSNVTTVETLIEDALGRAVAHATGSVVFSLMDPSPPPLSAPLRPVDEPVHVTPDPPRRPLPLARPHLQQHDATNEVPTLGSTPWDNTFESPFGEFLGVQTLELSKGRAKATMSTTEWFCVLYREVGPGIMETLCGVAAIAAAGTIAAPDQRLVTINVTTSFLAPVLPDGRQLTAVATVRSRRNDVVVVHCEVTDADGQTALITQVTLLLVNRRPRSSRQAAERVLLSVLFTDVVGSTERASQLGDTRWRELLDEHHALVRRQLELQKGREVKTTGDGFLATFDSPTRAVQCARAIREGVVRLGLAIRAGIHTGECELVGGDVAGLAVHVASRVQSAAQPGEILVSSTVRDLIAGSGLALVDRGAHALKGLEGTWTLLAVEDEP